MSKLLGNPNMGSKVIIGEYRSDIETDRQIEKRLPSVFMDINVLTTTEGKKLVPVQELLKIEKQLQLEKEETSDKAYKKGFEEGQSQGLDAGNREAQKVVQNFTTLVTSIVAQREKIYDEANRSVLELIMAIARKVTFNAVMIDEEITAKIIKGTIDGLIDKTRIKIKVNPQHLPLLESQLDRFKGDTTAIKEITIEPDNRVKYGGCFIETPSGDIDARVELQMEIISDALTPDEE